MDLQHFSHNHPLILEEDQLYDGEEFWCYGCLQPLASDPAYSCRKCNFFLHKSCAELPLEMTHPMHPEHPLSLLSPTLKGGSCDVCRQDLRSFTYRCSRCNFDLDIICASLGNSIQHHGHNHTLSIAWKRASFTCDACGTRHKEDGLPYICMSCSFWAHQLCALSPATIRITKHNHPLTLSYPSPEDKIVVGSESGCKWRWYCDICETRMTRVSWVYHCDQCNYVAHLGCAKDSAKRVDELSVVRLLGFQQVVVNVPFPDDSIDEATRLSKESIYGEISRADHELKHFSHDHPLILFNRYVPDELCYRTSETNKLIKNSNEICEGCVQPISAPYYSCSECRYFLHKWCSGLPSEIRYPLDPTHPFTLTGKAPEPFGLFQCYICEKYCHGFTYEYHPGFGIYLCIKCSSLPRILEHEIHEHPLILKCEGGIQCSACDATKFTSYMCATCSFSLDIPCALIQRIVRRKHEEHPLTLLCGFAEKKWDDTWCYCDICEEEINLEKNFYYYSEERLYYAHPICLLKNDHFSNIKLGGTFSVERHPHMLTLVRKTKGKPECSCCEQLLDDVFFECIECKFKLNLKCALKYVRKHVSE